MNASSPSRQPKGVPTGGQFAASARAEAGTVLAPETTVEDALSEVVGDPVHAAAVDALNNAVATDPDFAGVAVFAVDGSHIVFLDEHGDEISAYFSGGAIGVHSSDTAATSDSYRMDFGKPQTAEDSARRAVAAVKEVSATAASIRAFAAAGESVAADVSRASRSVVTAGDRDPARIDVDGHAGTFGVMSPGSRGEWVLIETYQAADQEFDGDPTMRVSIGDHSSGSATEFYVRRNADGRLTAMRDQPFAELADWEVRGLEAEIGARAGLSVGSDSIVQRLFTGAAAARQQDTASSSSSSSSQGHSASAPHTPVA